MEQVILPALGEGIEKAKVACWHASVGDQVAADTDVVELVTDKATFNVSAEASGILREICVSEGREAKIGEVLAVIEPR
jgi:pyruvate/2-oxoglutarate dehydrogenase complex dihydrolipoamide acyltransferase (E2) component